MSNLRKQLTAAASGRELVAITRSIRRADGVEGFMLAVGRQWLLLHVASSHIFLNGHCALRVRDIETVKPWDGGKGFVARALAHRGEFPEAPAGALDLDSTRALLETAAAIGPLVTIHIERQDPTVCHIGKPIGATPKTLWLHEITPAAEWEATLTPWPFRQITRVEFGARYEQALHALGGDPPKLRLPGEEVEDR